MQVQQNYPLKKYNTFGIEVYAKYFSAFSSAEELNLLLATLEHAGPLVLGGGSNILFIRDFDGLVLKNEICGIHTVHEDENHIYVKAGAGENWHSFVMHCVKNEFGGVENLALIPGNVGASPMQNIGAYGVEIKDVFHSLEAFHLKDRQLVNFSLNDCEFGYRESIFKKKYRHQFAILNVTYRLDKTPRYNISYGAVKEELEKMGVPQLSITAVSQAVINIRRSKLPNPAIIGNAGSFFKNPEIQAPQYLELKQKHPGLVGYYLHNNNVKLAAGWLIEQCGWKGFREGDAGCYDSQALVLVNYGTATGKEILDLSRLIQQSVLERFGIHLETEVNII